MHLILTTGPRRHARRRIASNPAGLRAFSALLLAALAGACDDRPKRTSSSDFQYPGRPGAVPASTRPTPAATRPAAPVAATQHAPKPPGYDADRVEPLREPAKRAGFTTLLLTSDSAQTVESRGGRLTRQSLMAREVFRQAVLIAGRDGLGLSTRDESLREPLAPPPPAEAGAPPLHVHWYLAPEDTAWFALADHDPAQEQLVRPRPRAGAGAPVTVRPWFEKSLKARKDAMGMAPVPELVEQAEALSRGELVEALQAAGFAGKANARDPDGGLADGVAARLDQLDLFAQFQAVREAHADVRKRGESPARLGALVRGYANLGQLAQNYWRGSSHNAFAARSLLYAQRMVSADPKSPPALWHRAYARALAGLHADALADLAAAGKAAGGAGDVKPPAFVALLDPYCRYQAGKLAKLAEADARRAPLAMFLCYLTVESAHSVSVPMEVGKAALEVDAGASRLVDSMCDRAGVRYLHVLTELGPQQFSQLMLSRLKPWAELPEPVRAAGRKDWQAPATRAAVARALVEAGAPEKDRAEPSWAALGRQVQEVHFLQVYRRAFFMERQWGVDGAGYAKQAEPLVADHPYALWLTAMTQGPDRIELKRLAEIPIIDNEGLGYEMIDVVTQVRYRAFPGYSGDIEIRKNRTAFHLERDLREPPAVGVLTEVSPHSPAAVAHLITTAWDEHADKVKAWEDNSDDHPTILAAFARRHTEAGQPAEAERFLKRYIERSPDHWAYDMLARNYLALGKEDEWLRTLEAFLKQEDYGLSHAGVQVTIARHFMSTRRYKRAEPYVLAANESGAGWAMLAAADLYEGLGRLDEAERWLRMNQERYGGPADIWHRWCLRTGRGDLAKAEQAARQVAERSAAAAARNPEAGAGAGVFYLIMGELDTARPLLDAAKTRPTAAMHAAMLAHAVDEYGSRDQAVQFAAFNADPRTMQFPEYQRLGRVAALLRDAWKEGPLATLDLKAVERAAAGAAATERTLIDYFVGKFHDLQGDRTTSTQYYTRCIRGERTTAAATLAWLELKKQGVDPRTLIAPAPEAAK